MNSHAITNCSKNMVIITMVEEQNGKKVPERLNFIVIKTWSWKNRNFKFCSDFKQNKWKWQKILLNWQSWNDKFTMVVALASQICDNGIEIIEIYSNSGMVFK